MFNITESHKNRNDLLKLDSFSEIELALSRSCNLKCVSCPHSIKEYQSFNKLEQQFMSVQTVQKIVDELIEINFDGLIDLAGLGEPTLNPNFIQIIKILKSSKAKISIVSNGLKLLNQKFLDELKDVLSDNVYLTISVYNSENLEYFEKLQQELPNTKLKHILFDLNETDSIFSEFSFNNRAGMVGTIKNDNSNTCYYPFFMLFVHPNGDFQYCPHSWTNDLVQYNINDMSLSEFWKQHTKLRDNMINYNRNNNSTCAKCNVTGTLIGEKCFNHYKDNNLIKV